MRRQKSQKGVKYGRAEISKRCKPYEKKLGKMGWHRRMKLLPPKIVQFMVETFCIDV